MQGKQLWQYFELKEYSQSILEILSAQPHSLSQKCLRDFTQTY